MSRRHLIVREEKVIGSTLLITTVPPDLFCPYPVSFYGVGVSCCSSGWIREESMDLLGVWPPAFGRRRKDEEAERKRNRRKRNRENEIEEEGGKGEGRGEEEGR